MPRRCSVCIHPDRPAIERALVDGTAYPAITALFRDTSADALGRHKAGHLPGAIALAQQAAEAAHGDDLLGRLEALAADAHRIKARAEAAGDLRTALVGVRELVRIIEVLGELRGELDRRPVTIVTSPEWIAVRGVLLAALHPYAEARTAVAAALVQLESGNGHGRG